MGGGAVRARARLEMVSEMLVFAATRPAGPPRPVPGRRRPTPRPRTGPAPESTRESTACRARARTPPRHQNGNHEGVHIETTTDGACCEFGAYGGGISAAGDVGDHARGNKRAELGEPRRRPPARRRWRRARSSPRRWRRSRVEDLISSRRPARPLGDVLKNELRSTSARALSGSTGGGRRSGMRGGSRAAAMPMLGSVGVVHVAAGVPSVTLSRGGSFSDERPGVACGGVSAWLKHPSLCARS